MASKSSLRDNPLAHARSKKELLAIQRAFAEIIRKPLLKNDRMIPDKRSKQMMLANSKLSEHERLELYAQQYWWRIIHSFDEDFKALKKLLGIKNFNKLRDEYLVKLPSKSFTLRNLGSRLPEFIKKSRTLNKSLKQAAFECASFEWGRIESFDAAEFESLTPKEVMTPGFDKKKLFLQPHIKLFTFKYPIHELIQGEKSTSNQMNSNVGVYDRNKKSTNIKPFKIKPKNSFIVLHRHENRVLMKPVSDKEMKVLGLFQSGCSLRTLDSLDTYFRGIDENEIYAWFRDWITLKWLWCK